MESDLLKAHAGAFDAAMAITAQTLANAVDAAVLHAFTRTDIAEAATELALANGIGWISNRLFFIVSTRPTTGHIKIYFFLCLKLNL